LTVTSGIRCLADVARLWSSKTPDKTALLDGGRVVSYAQLDHRSNRIANTLLAADIRPGSRIGYLGKNSAAFFEVWVGANKAGCALAPLNWRSAAAELVEVVDDAKVPLIFAGGEFTEIAERVRGAAALTVEVVPVDKIDQWSSEALIAGYKVPKAIHLMDALPQTASGKVQKAALRKHLEGMS
jgi:acyl-CoA synthetase (AMP-forming)/AMP-acid ligase II